jgi:hypothetical protein
MIVSSLLLLDFQAPALNLIRIVTIIPMKSIPLRPCPPSGFLSGVSPSSLDHPRVNPLFRLKIHLSRLALTDDSPAFSEIRWL